MATDTGLSVQEWPQPPSDESGMTPWSENPLRHPSRSSKGTETAARPEHGEPDPTLSFPLIKGCWFFSKHGKHIANTAPRVVFLAAFPSNWSEKVPSLHAGRLPVCRLPYHIYPVRVLDSVSKPLVFVLRSISSSIEHIYDISKIWEKATH